MIFPESFEETTPMNPVRPTKIKAKFRPKTTTTESPDYEEYHESEEEILAEGYNPTTTSTATPQPFNFLQQFKDRFPKIHDWLYDQETEPTTSIRNPRMPKTFFTHKKKKHLKQKPKTVYGVPKKPKSVLTPPKKFAPPRKPAPTTRKPKLTTPHAFEQEEDIQAAGFTKPPPRLRPPKRKPKPPVTFEQYPAQQMPAFESEQDIQPGGQRPTIGYNYPKPTEISREIFFYEPPQQFAPSKPKPFKQKPPLPPKKQFKVIFIKAPEPEPPVVPNIPQLQAAPEQKTLIYVVAKKPDEPPNITLSAPPEPSTEKPDVFFIRYKLTTPAPDETEEEVLPGGFNPPPKPKPGYKYPKPKSTTTTPPPEEIEEELLPGDHEHPNEYLPPDDAEEELLPGGQEPTKPTNEYLPPDESEEEVLPGGQGPTKPPKEYLPPPDETEEEILPAGQPPKPTDETEEEILPGGQYPPPPSPPYYPPPKPYPSNQYLPLSPQQPSYAPLPGTSWQNPNYGYDPPSVANTYESNQPFGSHYFSPSTNNYHNQGDKYSTPNTNYNSHGSAHTSTNSKYGYPNPTQGTPSYGSHNYKNPYGPSHYGNHHQKAGYSNNNYHYPSGQYIPKNVHTVHPPRQLSLPFRFNEQALHRQGETDDDASLK